MTVDETTPLLIDGSYSTPSNNRRTASIAAAMFGVILASGDEAFVLSTYGEIASSFNLLSAGSWVLTAYTLGYCIALPFYGNFSNIYGSKRMLIAANLIFASGCLISGTGLSILQVIAGRFISGIGGAGMITLVSVMITEFSSGGNVAVLRSYVNLVAMCSSSVAPPLGGLVSDTMGWRWYVRKYFFASFNLQVPIALLSLFCSAWALPSQVSPTGQIDADKNIDVNTEETVEKPRNRIAELDFLGILTFATMMTSLLLLLDVSGRATPSRNILLLYISITLGASTISFLIIETFWARNPFISLELFRTSGVGALCVVQILLMSGTLATLSQYPTYLMRVYETSGTQTAAFFICPAIGSAIGGLTSGVLISRDHSWKTISLVYTAICSFCFLLIALRWPSGQNIWELLYMIPMCFAGGMVLSSQFIGLLENVSKSETAMAVSVYYLSQKLGSTLGVGSGVTILQSVFRAQLSTALGKIPDKDSIVHRVLNDVRFSSTLPASLQSIIRTTFLSSFRYVPIFSVCTTIIALPIIAIQKGNTQSC